MSKPEIVSLSSGVHNDNLNAATSRITKGGSWKKQRVIQILPSDDMIAAKVALSWKTLASPPNQPAHFHLALGQEVGEAYSNSIADILAHPDLSQWEYIFTLESDNVGPPDGSGLVRLIQRMEEHPEFACIGGLYWTKGFGGVPQIWGDPHDLQLNFRPQPPDPNGGLVECCGTGMGFNLWRLSMFRDERLRKPWFKTMNGVEGKGIGTQDLYFWSDARQYGYRCAVDCSVLVGHYDHQGKFGPPGTMW